MLLFTADANQLNLPPEQEVCLLTDLHSYLVPHKCLIISSTEYAHNAQVLWDAPSRRWVKSVELFITQGTDLLQHDCEYARHCSYARGQRVASHSYPQYKRLKIPQQKLVKMG